MNRTQIVVINVCPVRKKYLEEQFDKLNLRQIIPIHYINAATINNLKDYLPSDENLKYKYPLMCCTRSHLYCLEFACLTSSPEFTIVIEDDAVFHKTAFIETVEEIINQWDMLVPPAKMVSLGWVPIQNKKWYSNLTVAHKLKHCNFVKNIINSGTQAYIVRKSDIKSEIDRLIYPTYEQLDRYIETYKLRHKKQFINSLAADNLLFEYFGQTIVYPPLIIERDLSSTLANNNWSLYWSKYFEADDKDLENYLI